MIAAAPMATFQPQSRRLPSRTPPSFTSPVGNCCRHGKIARTLKDDRGQTTLEFALLAVILILIVMGIIEGGRIFGTWLIITNEARESARYGAVGVGDPSRQPTLVADVENKVRQRTAGLLDQARLIPTATLTPTSLRVHISYSLELFATPLLVWFPNPVPLSADSTMRTEDGAVGGG